MFTKFIKHMLNCVQVLCAQLDHVTINGHNSTNNITSTLNHLLSTS